MKNNKFKLFILIISLLIKIQISIDCTSCTIENKTCICGDGLEDCRWLKISSDLEKCMECTEISKGESQYYSRKFTVENEPYCHKVGKSGYSGAKLIFKTNQIVNDCKELGLYKLGDICYDSCPDNSNHISDNVCSCSYLYYYKEIKEGLTYITCLENESSCPPEYNYINGNEFTKSCPTGKTCLGIEEWNNKDYFCREECNKYYSIKSLLGKTNKYCYNTCPDNEKFYYDDNKCIEKCSVKDIYNKDNKCIDLSKIKPTDCGSNYFIKVSPEDYIFQCSEITADNQPCPSEFPLKYNKNEKIYCLKSCEDTNIPFFDNKITYLYSENNECIDISNTDLYKIEKEKRFVSDCSKEAYWPYHIGKNCVPNCGDKYIDNETNECLENCKSDYYKDIKTKICFKKCPDYLGRGFYDDDRICVSCGIDGEGKGFHKEKDDYKCYSQCPAGYKHNHLNNICFEGNCKDHDYKFSYEEDSETCYYSCKDIGNDYIIEKEYKCYKESEVDANFNDYYFYQTSYGFKKYINKNDAVKECFKNGLKYIRGNECVEKCNADEYKVYPTNEKLGICYLNVEQCKNNNYKFYNNSKICSDICEYYTIKDNTGTIYVLEGNCLIECPSAYQFLDGKICKEKCDECYIEEDGIKKCSSKVGYFIQKIGENNKCVKYCTNSIEGKDNNGIPIFSYYDSNKNCLDTCNGNQGNEFSYLATNKHQQCKSSCENDEYYYEEEKICLKKCDKYIKEKESKICVDKCENGEYILPGKYI